MKLDGTHRHGPVLNRRPAGWAPALVTVAVSIFVCLVLPAVAFADVEPNDNITEAEGPLVGGVTYTGAIATENDRDIYLFYVSGQQQLKIQAANTGGSCLTVEFGDTNDINLAEAGEIHEGHTAEFAYTTPPGLTRYYLDFSDCSGETKYSFIIMPAAAVVGGAPTLPPTPTGEPNENAEEAIGPLLGNIAYTGEIQTQNDEDWFKFFTASGSHQFDIAYTETGPSC